MNSGLLNATRYNETIINSLGAIKVRPYILRVLVCVSLLALTLSAEHQQVQETCMPAPAALLKYKGGSRDSRKPGMLHVGLQPLYLICRQGLYSSQDLTNRSSPCSYLLVELPAAYKGLQPA